jgi:hypothetical protein
MEYMFEFVLELDYINLKYINIEHIEKNNIIKNEKLLVNILDSKYNYNMIKFNNINNIKQFIQKKYVKIKKMNSIMIQDNIINKITTCNTCCICYEQPSKNIILSCCFSLFC